MFDCLITFRSVMPVQRAEERLQSEGIGCQVRRTPKWMERQGCGYSLWLEYSDLPSAVALLRSGKISYRKLYRRAGERLEELLL
jgi:hypothetical protein